MGDKKKKCIKCGRQESLINNKCKKYHDEECRPDDECGNCQRPVRESENGLQCDGCDIWYHAGCERIPVEMYKMYKKYKEELWFCQACKPTVKQYIRKMRDIEAKQQDLIARVEQLEKGTINKDIDGLVQNITVEEMEEREDRKRRKNNIVLYNLPESDEADPKEREREDNKMCEDLFTNHLKVAGVEIDKVIRLGRKVDHRNRPVLVKLQQDGKKWDILSNAECLKNETNLVWKKIGIAPDMTKRQRDQNKKLREELQEKRNRGERGWYIKQGQLMRNTAYMNTGGAAASI